MKPAERSQRLRKARIVVLVNKLLMYFQATTTIPPSTAKTKCEDDRSSFHFDLINRQETPIHATPFGLALLILSVGAQPLQRLHDNKR